MLITVPAPRPAGFGSWPGGGREVRAVLPGASELPAQRKAAGRLPGFPVPLLLPPPCSNSPAWAVIHPPLHASPILCYHPSVYTYHPAIHHPAVTGPSCDNLTFYPLPVAYKRSPCHHMLIAVRLSVHPSLFHALFDYHFSLAFPSSILED